MTSQDAVQELMSIIESRVETLRQELKEIDEELKVLNAEIEVKLSRKAELTSRRLQITRLLQLLEPVNEHIEINNSRKRDPEIDEKVYQLFRSNPEGLTQLQIAKILGIPPSTAYHSCQRLLTSGHIVKDGAKYRIP
jgi:predicted transcriptional regulator